MSKPRYALFAVLAPIPDGEAKAPVEWLDSVPDDALLAGDVLPDLAEMEMYGTALGQMFQRALEAAPPDKRWPERHATD